MNELMQGNPFLPALEIIKYLILPFPVLFLGLRAMTKFQKQDKWVIFGFSLVCAVAWFPVVLFNPYSAPIVLIAGLGLACYDFQNWLRRSRSHEGS